MARWIWMPLFCLVVTLSACGDSPTGDSATDAGGDGGSSALDTSTGDCSGGCDDGNPCTFDECKTTYCWSTPLIGTPCDDGNACTAPDATACQEDGTCGGSSLINCKDSNPCTSDACDPAIGCVFPPMNEGDGCNDGNACTTGDICVGGACMGADIPCEDAETCRVFAGCDPVLGSCLEEVLPDGMSCEDDNLCTANDVCEGGACVPGGMTECFDGNVCTDDDCTPKGGCVFAPNTKFCDDSDPCTSSDQCAGGQCKGDGLSCDDGNPCTSDSCTENLECIHTSVSQVCDDGNTCTVGDTCVDGACSPGSLNDCDDGNVCTSDSCQPANGGCVHQDTVNPCDDGNICTVSDSCNGGVCQGTPTTCYDGNSCTGSSCNAITGCLYESVTGPCDDGNFCTIADSCADGECVGYSLCDDSNPCTQDECMPDGGCDYVSLLGAACSDGSLCTEGDVCGSGGCVGEALDCKDGDVCTFDYCNAQMGCVNENIVDTFCNDGLECTLDGCDETGGCYHLAKEGPCGVDGQGICAGDICCYPECAGKICGSDGCGGTCGLCDSGKKCVGGQCQTTCVPSAECGTYECLDLALNVCVNKTVHIPVGSLWMGCNLALDNNCDVDELPQHQVFLYAFDIDITEVTNAALAAFLNANDNQCPLGPCVDESEVGLQVWKQFGVWVAESNLDEYPAVHVPWAAAEAYCSWAGKRLPTEAEWEKAARGGCEIYGENCQTLEPVYPWGNSPADCGMAVMKGPLVGCGAGMAHAVGSFPQGASPYGVLDMAGNVWEWVADWYAGDAFCNGPAASCYVSCSVCVGSPPYTSPWVDPAGPTSTTHRVVRGGGYWSQAEFVRASLRGGYEPELGAIDTGFRCVISDF